DFTPDEVQALLPKAGGKTPVSDPVVRKIAKEALLDFVRGQSGAWTDAQIRKAAMTVEPAPGKEGLVSVRYQGEFDLGDAGRGFDGKLYGTASYDARSGRFVKFELAAAGMRKGKTENFRGNEPPSPLGVAFVIEGQYEKAGAPASTGLGLGTKSEDKDKKDEKEK